MRKRLQTEGEGLLMMKRLDGDDLPLGLLVRYSCSGLGGDSFHHYLLDTKSMEAAAVLSACLQHRRQSSAKKLADFSLQFLQQKYAGVFCIERSFTLYRKFINYFPLKDLCYPPLNTLIF